jgi:Arc/MetJ-type ribon-helix-helix transcriptional regulator
MNISLKPELQRYIEEQVRTGQFATPEDVIEAGLGRLRADDFGDFQPGEMEKLIEAAEAEFARGEGHTLAEVRQRFRNKSEARSGD